MGKKRSRRNPEAASPQARRRQRTATGVRRGDMIVEAGAHRQIDYRVAPPRYAERRHARPGAGTKRARAVMTKPKQKR